MGSAEADFASRPEIRKMLWHFLGFSALRITGFLIYYRVSDFRESWWLGCLPLGIKPFPALTRNKLSPALLSLLTLFTGRASFLVTFSPSRVGNCVRYWGSLPVLGGWFCRGRVKTACMPEIGRVEMLPWWVWLPGYVPGSCGCVYCRLSLVSELAR